MGVVAAVILLAGGTGVLLLLDRGGSDNGVLVTGPAGGSNGSVLEWAEFDPGLDGSDYCVSIRVVHCIAVMYIL